MTKYIGVAFFRGKSLRPVPPGESKSKDTPYLHIHEDPGAPGLYEAQLAAGVKQGSQLPGERMWPSRRRPRLLTTLDTLGILLLWQTCFCHRRLKSNSTPCLP